MNQFTTGRFHALCELNQQIHVGPLLLAVGTVFFLSHQPAAAEVPKTLATHKVEAARIYSVAFSPDGKYLAFPDAAPRYGWKVNIWNVALKKVERSFTGHKGEIMSLAFTPDGKTLASGARDGTVKLWDLQGRNAPITLAANDGKVDKPGQRWEVESVAFSPDGKTVAAGSNCWMGGGPALFLGGFAGVEAGEARLWNVTTGKVMDTVKDKRRVSVAFAPKGKTLAIVFISGPFVEELNFEIRLWDLTGETEQWKITTKPTSRVTFSPDGKTLAWASEFVTLWDVGTKKEIRTAKHDWGHAGILAFAPNGKTLVLGTNGPTVSVWDVLTGKEKAKLSDPVIAKKSRYGDNVQSLAFSPDGKMLAVGTWDGYLLIWDSTRITQ
jgi:WD40 repeat protein